LGIVVASALAGVAPSLEIPSLGAEAQLERTLRNARDGGLPKERSAGAIHGEAVARERQDGASSEHESERARQLDVEIGS
jgi:hypothetical protein